MMLNMSLAYKMAPRTGERNGTQIVFVQGGGTETVQETIGEFSL